ncbi:MAG: biosynthetic arginine decarboxylase [Planctomycetota bacterium]|nr:MAG: biosynthetic arginine decarboxylase [Planctomycetota bacterium]
MNRVLRPWTCHDSEELYAIGAWGQGLLSVSAGGNLCIHPRLYGASASASNGERPAGNGTPAIDLKELVDELAARGISTPVLLRFPDLLAGRVAALNEAFRAAIEDNEYQGEYRGVYPIKVNQERRVVRRILAAGRRFHYGLEAGSKPELLAAMALLDDPEALLICNGYKDEYYVETALLAEKLGLRVILVIEKPTELPLILDVAERLGVRPRLGVRVKLTARGAGRWRESGGDRSKFGLNAREMLAAVELLRERGRLDSLELLHFHLGSQISAIRSIKNALREATRFYVELHRLGAGLRYLDVGGGLGVDYDGSQTKFHSSMNYSLQEYANDVVYYVGEICDEASVPHPILVSESGRAVVAHHAVLVLDVLGVNALATSMPRELPEDAAPVVRRLWESQEELSRKNLIETYHDALEFKEEALQLFNLGHLSLDQRVLAESIFWALCERILRMTAELDEPPEELEGLEKALSDTYFCNFSIFQSLPDTWAIQQMFPVVPLHRLTERPTRRGILADITCDSDGKINKFIDAKDVKDVLELHPFRNGEKYYLGVFLVGAYQEILGDLHNLFGDTNEVLVTLGEAGRFEIDHVESGETVGDVLRYVGYHRGQLMKSIRTRTEQALRERRMTPQESRTLIRSYESGLAGTTYLEPPA